MRAAPLTVLGSLLALGSLVFDGGASRQEAAARHDTPVRTIRVASASDLRAAIEAARPGDHVVLADGEYEGDFEIRAGGTAARPLVIRADRRGRAALVGQARLLVRGAEWVTVEGLRFRQAHGVRLIDSGNVRITRNYFRLDETENPASRSGESLHWVSIRGSRSHHNRVDHNLFEVKRAQGHFVLVEGSTDPAALSRHDRIDHNHFRDAGPFGEGMEALRIGVSRLALLSSFTIVEHNLFEGCDGDMEIISVKASDVTVRHNTVVGSQGALTARHGHRARFIGNTILGRGRSNTGGFRLYGDDHQVIGNYVEGVRDEPGELVALALDNGNVDHPPPYEPGELARHFRVRRALVAFNTFVGNRQTLRIGATSFVRAADGMPPETWTRGALSPRQPPTGLVVANNIFAGEGPIIEVITPPENSRWVANLLFASGRATSGLDIRGAGVLLGDPRLVPRGGRLMLSEGSPAIDRASGAFRMVAVDLEGQHRPAPFDIGADEYSTAPVLCPLLKADAVGPDAQPSTQCPLSAREDPP